MDLNKSKEFFDPSTVSKGVTIVGCGAEGSQVAVLLARLGVAEFYLYDTDTVASHNIANQNFTFADIGRKKTECVSDTILAINPEAKVCIKDEFVTDKTILSGDVFVCVDNVEARKTIGRMLLQFVDNVFDFRMGLTCGTFYHANKYNLDDYLLTLQFTDAEAEAAVPVSACGFELSVAYSIWTILGVGVSLVVRHWKGEKIPMCTIIDTGNLNIIST